MKAGLVSVMMPAYNAEAFVGKALDSLLLQEYPDWEAIVINDGSTDGTSEVLNRYSDPRVRVFHQENGGEAAARNSALARLRGEFVAFLDADDLFLPAHLALAVAYLRAHPEHDGVYTDGYHIDAEGRQLDRISKYRRGPFAGRIFEEVVRASDVFGPPLCMILRTRTIFDNHLEYDASVGLGTDWDFNIRLCETASFGHIDQATCLYRIHQDNITLTTSDERRAYGQVRCRETAIKLSGFSNCSLSVRSYVFFDLLVNLLPGNPDRQTAITQWAEFTALPPAERARLFRLMAGRALLLGADAPHVGRWFRAARLLRPADPRNRMLESAYSVSPALCRLLLLVRQRVHHGASAHTAFGDLGLQGVSARRGQSLSPDSGLTG
jgi:glycosyltransferase involved in cell wall biosynthesis